MNTEGLLHRFSVMRSCSSRRTVSVAQLTLDGQTLGTKSFRRACDKGRLLGESRVVVQTISRFVCTSVHTSQFGAEHQHAQHRNLVKDVPQNV